MQVVKNKMKILCNLSEIKDEDMPFNIKVKYNQILKNIIIQAKENAETF